MRRWLWLRLLVIKQCDSSVINEVSNYKFTFLCKEQNSAVYGMIY